jgi:hypothetical protein
VRRSQAPSAITMGRWSRCTKPAQRNKKIVSKNCSSLPVVQIIPGDFSRLKSIPRSNRKYLIANPSIPRTHLMPGTISLPWLDPAHYIIYTPLAVAHKLLSPTKSKGSFAAWRPTYIISVAAHLSNTSLLRTLSSTKSNSTEATTLRSPPCYYLIFHPRSFSESSPTTSPNLAFARQRRLGRRAVS